MLKFLDAREFTKNVSLTIQKSGIITFSSRAVNVLKLDKYVHILFATDEDENLYIKVDREESDNGFKVYTNNRNVFFLKASSLLKFVGIDYRKEKLTFKLVYDEENSAYRLVKKDKK